MHADSLTVHVTNMVLRVYGVTRECLHNVDIIATADE